MEEKKAKQADLARLIEIERMLSEMLPDARSRHLAANVLVKLIADSDGWHVALGILVEAELIMRFKYANAGRNDPHC